MNRILGHEFFFGAPASTAVWSKRGADVEKGGRKEKKRVEVNEFAWPVGRKK